LTLNQWHYLVGTYDGQTLRLFVNGQLVTSKTLDQPVNIVTNELPIYIGESPNLAEGFTGLIDNVKIYKAAKPQHEIEAAYTEITAMADINLKNDGADVPFGSKFDFGGVHFGTSNTWTFEIENKGLESPLTVTEIRIAGIAPSGFTIQNAPAFPFTVEAGNSVTFDIRFEPPGPEKHDDMLLILSNDADEATYQVALTGKGSVVGDFNANGVVDLGDAILVLQVLTGMNPGGLNLYADADDDGKIGMGDMIYILEKLSEMR